MSDMLKKPTKYIFPAAGKSCNIGLASLKRFTAKFGGALITHQRKREFKHAAHHIHHNFTIIQGEITDLSDLDLIYATFGAEKGPSLSINATKDNDYLFG